MDKKAWLRIQKYCAWQERCHQEVRAKLKSLGVYGLDCEEMISRLIEENFLNEERFSRAYAGGKFRVRKWGRERIRRELKQRQISAYCIRVGLEEINEDQYQQTMDDLIKTKMQSWSDLSDFDRNGKVAAFLIRKGYETDLVWNRVKAYPSEK